MINLPGSKGHHHLKADKEDLEELVDTFYEAFSYHDFSHLKFILSPKRRVLLQNFLDNGDESILEGDNLYFYVLKFFKNKKENIIQMKDVSYHRMFRQTAMLLGFTTEKLLEIIETKSIFEFLLEKLTIGKPNYSLDFEDDHELKFLESITCRNKDVLCPRCKRCQKKTLKTSKIVQDESKLVMIDEEGNKTFSTIL